MKAWTWRPISDVSVAALNRAARRLPTWVVYLLGALPGPVVFYQGLTGGLGPEPIKALEHALGLYALQFLLAGLAISPLRRLAGLNLIRFRRALGLLAFYYVSLHLLVWLLLDVQVPAAIWADLVKRPYITVGMAGFLLLLPLALTSNSFSIRRLGRRWRQLHRAVYAAVLLGALHFVMLRKGLQIEPLIYFSLAVGLLALRLPLPRVCRKAE
ncbi:protein-methionine-sulfoxide reductase heme-binding subunit MsrQ [Pseudodonghicola flavimaris]|uniref:Protein-methionine-sulfoxide reductase heme-binding subunit MsrQ n=1 Tax=Pseudodonghicola flavimaris TaxID=3050036 RepID=A0ABT7EZ58_9RHOB|nr:protein-methionine-sulfoxide reductase heme-binding subunit MsrQ [Pseudodonghicola flavimaris]MDK3017636.1 protein-methionine-sulfoxide reductase heme-binding subunit MsrQ [Pseudodonghicola flavimaris]